MSSVCWTHFRTWQAKLHICIKNAAFVGHHTVVAGYTGAPVGYNVAAVDYNAAPLGDNAAPESYNAVPGL